MIRSAVRLAFPVLAALAVALLPSLPVRAVAPLGDSEFPRDWFYDNDEQWKAHEPLVGKPMPKIEAGDWLDKKAKVNFKKDTAGKVVVIDLWATWCGPCKQAIPHNKELVEKYGKDGMVFVAICTANGQEALEKVAAEHKIDYPTCKDPGEKASKAFAVQYYPTYVAIDRAGKVRAVGLKPEKVEEVVKKLLAEPAPEAAAK